MQIKITPNDAGNPPGKLADAALHFEHKPSPSNVHDCALAQCEPLAGLKLIGFSIWERRGTRYGINITFPARQYSVNGERRSFALLRSIVDLDALGPIKSAIIQAWNEYAISTYQPTDKTRIDAEERQAAERNPADYASEAAAAQAEQPKPEPEPTPEPAPAKFTPPDILF